MTTALALAEARRCGLSAADAMFCVAQMPRSPYVDLWATNAVILAVQAAHYAHLAMEAR